MPDPGDIKPRTNKDGASKSGNDKFAGEIKGNGKNVQGQSVKSADRMRDLRELLKHVKVNDLLEKISSSGGQEGSSSSVVRKTRNDYQFWKTQPVTDFDEQIFDEGPIDKDQNVEKVPKEAYNLLEDFEWCTVEIKDAEQLNAVHVLLRDNYVEDSDASFRFNYPPSFLKWAMLSPGYRKNWHVAVRVKSSKKLVAFISAVPISLNIRGKILNASEVNFLCVHKKLRSKRLAPIMIKEITRRCHLENVWQALYTSGTLLPSPVSTCRFYHRILNWKKLYNVGFTYLPPGSTIFEQEHIYKIPSNSSSIDRVRRMTASDLPAVANMLQKYLQKFEIYQCFTDEELEHWLLQPDCDEDERTVWAYVIENKKLEITDFFSFYSLPSSVLKMNEYKTVEVAYLFYYASRTDIDVDKKNGLTQALKHRLQEVMREALIAAKKLNFDVLNSLTLMDNNSFLEPLKFGPGDGMLNYYLYNYRARPVSSGMKKDGSIDPNGSGLGIVML